MLRWLFAIGILALGCGSRSGLLSGAGGAGGSAGAGGSGGAGGAGGGGGAGGVTPDCVHSEPTVLANGVEGAHAIEVDSTHAYFTIASDAGQVLRVDKLGGAVEVIATGLGRPRHLALWGEHVYVTSPMTGHVVRAKKDGSEQTVMVAGPPHPEGIASGDWGVVWIRRGVLTSELWRAPGGGSDVQHVTGALASPYDLALDGPDAFVVDNGSGGVAPGVVHVDLASGATAFLLELSAANAHDIALDETHAYVVLNAEALRVRRDGSELEKLGEGVFLRGITLAGERVYWAERGAGDSIGRIVRRNSDGTMDVLVEDDAFPEGIANDGACVYWTSSGGLGKDGSVRAAPL